MKKLFVLLALLPRLAFAQHFEIGINGGFDFHSLPIDNDIAHQDKPVLGYAIGLRGCLLLPDAQLGIAVEAVQLVETDYLSPNYTMKIKNYPANPLAVPFVFYNRVRKSAPGYIYAGGMAGPVIAKVGVNSFEYGSGTAISGYTTQYNTAMGLVFGLQAGGVMYLKKNFEAAFEAGMRFTSFTYSAPGNLGENPYKYRIFYFPITVGLRYRIK